jgi:hypothetical protein
MDAEISTNEGISRRTIVKGAAWSIPVMAAAVAAPAAVATGGPNWDVTVSGVCDKEYDISALTAVVGAGLTNTVKALLFTVLGFEDGAKREFTITATDGTVPAGTTFALTYPTGLINLVTLEGLIEANALTVVTINPTGATFSLNAPLTEGQSITFNIITAIIDVALASSVTLSLVGNDNPAGAEGADSATVTTLVGVSVKLRDLLPTLPANARLAVQICG